MFFARRTHHQITRAMPALAYSIHPVSFVTLSPKQLIGTSQADDFRERGGAWSRARTLETKPGDASDRKSLAQRRPVAVAGQQLR
jgi:hypothetical protein